jgi:hypothetical protein
VAVLEKKAKRPPIFFAGCGHDLPITPTSAHSRLVHSFPAKSRWGRKGLADSGVTVSMKTMSSDKLRSIIVGGERSLEQIVREMETRLPCVSEAYAHVVWKHTENLPCLQFIPEFEKRFQSIERELKGLHSSHVSVFTSFAPEPYDLLHPIYVSIYQTDRDEYTASFADANLHASGDTEHETLENLKSLILDLYDSLVVEKEEDLGPEPKRQLLILQSFLSKRLSSVHPG